ncbi:hypothetical protein H5410_046505 [Solanum commersonii]|uniref:Uncharacterized protein n=1 Tax=Solanum commersonii TaxID=4109 RepID=A0A9J5XEL8_SOLCO|nr:hypothetical protein H5410_046505 [Solanum commersonii]
MYTYQKNEISRFLNANKIFQDLDAAFLNKQSIRVDNNSQQVSYHYNANASEQPKFGEVLALEANN